MVRVSTTQVYVYAKDMPVHIFFSRQEHPRRAGRGLPSPTFPIYYCKYIMSDSKNISSVIAFYSVFKLNSRF